MALNIFSKESGISKKTITIKEVIPFEHNGELVFRVINFKPTGYIVVSADDNTEPILGYGLDTEFNLKNIPSALLYLLGEYKKEITYIKEKKLKADEKIRSKWETYSSLEYTTLKSYSPGTYLLESNWGQSGAFNQSCPLDPNTGNRCLVGCTAVALGQILKYWECKVFPDGTRTYTPNIYFTNPLTINFYDQDYDWDEIGVVGSATADLLYHCGVAIRVNYTDSATSGYSSRVEYAIENNFGFQTSGIQYKSSNESSWINMLKADIDAGRPIYYAGTNATITPNTAHAWVVDGYKTDNTFHCNWGWSGSYSGNEDWFSLADLTPGSHNYNTNQHALIGAEPILDACLGLEGANAVCASNESYSVSIPSSASVVWSKSSNLDQVGGNTSPTYIVNSGSSGTGSVTATIKNSQNQTFLTRTKEVSVGTPTFYIDGPSTAPNNQWAYFTAQSQGGLADFDDYNWILSPLNGNSVYDYGHYCDIAFYNSGDYQLVGQAFNTCGWGDYTIKWIHVYDSYSMMVSPNPATTEATITIAPKTSEDASLKSATTQLTIDETAEWEMEVYSTMQSLKAKQTKIRGSSTKINTQSWKEGVYTIRAKYKDQILTGKLVVKK